MKKFYLLSGFLTFLSFTNIFAQCSTTNATSCVCAQSGSTNCDLLPDLIVGKPPLLVSGNNGVIEYSQTGNGVENGRLRVSVSSPNIGYGPLEVRTDTVFICGTDTFYGTSPGTCPGSGLPPKQLLNQRVYHKNGNVMSYYTRKAGSMTYHPTHGHMHVDDWGIYTLRTATANPNPLTWPIVGTGSKLAFCLMDYGSCTGYSGHCVDSIGNTLLNGNFPNFGLGGGAYSCSAIVQGISSGYTDIYYQYLDGMYLTIPPGTCNGTYYIVVQLDPYNYFLESNENNNVLAIPYTLTLQSGTIPTVSAGGPTTFCPGGSVTLTASAGTSYLWSNGATTQAISATATGNYLVTVSSASCTGTSQPVAVNVNTMNASSNAVNTSICTGGSTQLSATATTSGTSTTQSVFTNSTVINIPDNSPTGVTSSINVTGINPATLSSNSVFSVSINITHTSDGDLMITLISPSGNQIILSNRRGGTGNHFTNTTFSMSAGTAIASGTPPFSGTYIPDGVFSAFTGIANGTWQLKVADMAGNDIGTINSWTLRLNTQVPNGISYAWTSNPPGFTSTSQNPSVTPGSTTVYTVTATDVVTGCTGTSTVGVTVNALPTASISAVSPVCTGGTIAFNLTTNGSSFAWSGPGNFSSSSQNPTISNVTNGAAGNYQVTVTGNGGCTSTASASVNVLNQIIINASFTNVNCNGGSNGSINLNLTNGNSPVYLWSNGATTQDISGLPAGNYQVTVSNSACIQNGNYTITEPAVLGCVCNSNITNVTCRNGANGSVTSLPSGGTPPYTYLWSNGQTTQTSTGLIAGSYSVTITDAKGCSVNGNAVITQPAVLAATAVVTKATCAGVNNGAINVSVSGGTQPFNYLWSNGATVQDISGVAKGPYTVTITDFCGASIVKNFTVNLLTNPISLILTKTNVRCAGTATGIASVSVTTGAAPYTYSWNTVPVKTTATVSGLTHGTYTVTVTDATGCTKSGSVNIIQPYYLTAIVTQTNASFPGANDGSISLAVSGGTGPYTFLWNTVPANTTASLTGLTAGVYKCTIKDAQLCVKKITVTITEPPAINHTGNAKIQQGISEQFVLSPNPSMGIVEFNYFADRKNETLISILDVIGNKVFTQRMKLVKGENSRHLDLRMLPKGIYFVELDIKGKKVITKLVLQ